MEKEKVFDVPIHYLMAVCGGFLGAYALLSRMDIFGSAQTANLIELVCDILGRDLSQAAIRLGALLIYGGSMVLSAVLAKKTSLNLKYLTIVLDACVVIAIGFFPVHMDPLIALYPVFFVTAFQWCVFKGAKGYVSSTIFSTNNMKQTVLSVTEYLLCDASETEQKQQHARKAAFFGGTILSFHTQVALEYLARKTSGMHSIWFCILPLSASLGLLLLQEESLKNLLGIRKAGQLS